MPDLVIGINSYVSLAEADAYLAGSLQAAAAWAAQTDETKQLALISAYRALEREPWAGDDSAVQQVLAVLVAAGGTGYAIGDVLSVDGGTGTAALVEVLTVGGGGEILTLQMLSTGYYSADPTSPAATTSVSGVGVGGTLTLTLADQVGAWPRDITACAGYATQSTTAVPTDLKSAQCELAWVLSEDPAQESNVGASAGGTGSNIAKVEAGSAKVTYFRPTDGTPWPTITWQLIKGLREGSCGDYAVGNAAYGTGDSSAFEDPCGLYGLNRGYA